MMAMRMFSATVLKIATASQKIAASRIREQTWTLRVEYGTNN